MKSGQAIHATAVCLPHFASALLPITGRERDEWEEKAAAATREEDDDVEEIDFNSY